MELRTYLDQYQNLICDETAHKRILSAKKAIEGISASKGTIYLAGNGASAALASHAATDFTKQARVPARTFHDPALMTAFANDFGYENWISKSLEYFLNPNDIVVLISVSGESKSVVNAAKAAKSMGVPVVSFTGRISGNSLAKVSDINLHVESHAYNVVENVHSIWVTAIIDLLIGTDTYEVS